jgi:hypothetical protein
MQSVYFPGESKMCFLDAPSVVVFFISSILCCENNSEYNNYVFLSITSLYRINAKYTAKLTGMNLHHNTRKKMLYEHRPSEVWFPSYGFLTIKENV